MAAAAAAGAHIAMERLMIAAPAVLTHGSLDQALRSRHVASHFLVWPNATCAAKSKS